MKITINMTVEIEIEEISEQEPDEFPEPDERCGKETCLLCYGTQEEYAQGYFNTPEPNYDSNH